MKRIVVLMLLLVAALSLVPVMGQASSHCTDIDTTAGVKGTLCADESGASLDGDSNNPDPLDGYVAADANGVCADDNGSPGNSTSATCAP